MASSRDREAWAHIFKLYKGLPHLWDKNNINYGNRSMMTDGYKILTRAYRVDLDRQASVGALRMKMKNLRTTYYRELRKIRLAKQKGERYTPSLWYFENLNFLENPKLNDSPATPSANDITEDSSHVEDIRQVENSTQIDDLALENSDIEVDFGTPNTQSKVIKRTEPQKLSSRREPETAETKTMQDEHWEVIGKSIGFQLKDLKKRQFTIVSKLISDAIYYGRLNKLSEASHIEIGPNSFINSHSLSPHYNTYVPSGHGFHAVDVLNSQNQSTSFKHEEDSEEVED